VTRFRSLLPARVAVALAIGLSVLVGTPAAARAAQDPEPPLTIHLDSVSPAAIPKSGPITITGTVTNSSDETWSSISLYPLTSYTPMTTHSQLVEAAASDSDAVIGDRIVADGKPLGKLAPNETRSFTLTLRHRDLVSHISGAPGVYWLGVHALGSGSKSGSDTVADGRARTFIPLVPARKAKSPVPVSLVLPLRQAVHRDVDGAVSDPKAWEDDLSSSGGLGKLLNFAQAGAGQPLTWLADPAVLQTLDDLSQGNPGLGLGPASMPSPSPSPSASATSGAADGAGTTPNPYRDWLRLWTTSAQQNSVLTLPYADPDVSAVGVNHLNLLQQAWKLGSSVLNALSVKASRAIAPVDGALDRRTLAPQAAGTTVFTAARGTISSVASLNGLRYAQTDGLVTADAGADSLVEARQRILADVAVRSLTRDRSPIVVVVPPVWSSDPAANEDFFAPFESFGWTQLTSLPTGTPVSQVRIPWTARNRSALIPDRNINASTRLATTAATATALFEDKGAIGTRLAGIALDGVSQSTRAHPATARVATTAVDTAMQVLLGDIEVEGTDFVTLSGNNGVFTLAMHNGLNKPIKVGLSARSEDPRLKLSVPGSAELAAGRRTTLRLQARVKSVGVHDVRVQPVTTTGAPVGRPFVFAVRTSQVGQFFWYVVLAGTAVVLLMVVRRVRLRIRARRKARTDAPESDEPDPTGGVSA